LLALVLVLNYVKAAWLIQMRGEGVHFSKSLAIDTRITKQRDKKRKKNHVQETVLQDEYRKSSYVLS